MSALKLYPSLLAATLLMSATVSHAGIIHVPGDYPTIQQAINVAGAGDEILVAPGTYFENLYFPPGMPNVRVHSESGPEDTIIDGQTRDRVANFDRVSGPVILQGFTVVHGQAGTFGGGIAAFGSNVVITGNIITHNLQLTYGGAGGGIYFDSGCSAQCQVVENLIVDNIGSNGAGIYTTAGILIRSNTIVGNESFHVLSHGGGIRSWGATIENNIIAGNSADDAGGVYCDASSEMSCNDLYANSGPPVNGACHQASSNFSADPLFCNPLAGDYTLDERSPCLPPYSPPGCGLIGAYGAGCGPVAVEPSTWGRIKATYR